MAALQNIAWLDASYVQNILRNAENDESIKVSELTIKLATAKGDNYASDMRRVNVNLSRLQDTRAVQEEKSLIFKCLPEGKVFEELTESAGIFEREISMMSVTLPKMRELLENVCSTSISAKCFHVQLDKPTHLVLEDLAPRGFRLADRRAGLDLDHFSIAIENLARFHASSVALREKDPTSMTTYNRGGVFRKDQSPAIIRIFDGCAQTLAAESVGWDELSPQITNKLGKLSNTLFEKACEIAKYREEDFNVLNHGDTWTNNMLFRYDEQQRPIDHIFVDFQISYHGAQANDVLYFLGTSASDDVRLQHRELVLRKYHDEFTNTMAELKCNTKVPSFEEFLKSLKEKAFLEVIATIIALPFVLLEKGEEIKLEDMMAQDSNRGPSYSGAACRKAMTQFLTFYDDLGSLDV